MNNAFEKAAAGVFRAGRFLAENIQSRPVEWINYILQSLDSFDIPIRYGAGLPLAVRKLDKLLENTRDPDYIANSPKPELTEASEKLCILVQGILGQDAKKSMQESVLTFNPAIVLSHFAQSLIALGAKAQENMADPFALDLDAKSSLNGKLLRVLRASNLYLKSSVDSVHPGFEPIRTLKFVDSIAAVYRSLTPPEDETLCVVLDSQNQAFDFISGTLVSVKDAMSASPSPTDRQDRATPPTATIYTLGIPKAP